MKIPCFALTWFDYEAVKEFVETVSLDERIEIIIIENRSRYTESHIMPYVLEKIEEGKVRKYYTFDKNISNNAMSMVLDLHKDFIASSEYILFTDGDVIPLPAPPAWLDEEIAIMERHPELFCCNLHIDWSDEPINTQMNVLKNNPKRNYHDDYIEMPTGNHLSLFRGKEFREYQNYKEEGNRPQLDSTMRNYAIDHNKTWGKTYDSLAKQCHWFRRKMGKEWSDLVSHSSWEVGGKRWRIEDHYQWIWCSPRSCSFTEYQKGMTKRFRREVLGGSVFMTEYGE